MSEEDVNEILDGLNVPPKATTQDSGGSPAKADERPKRIIPKPSTKTSYDPLDREKAAIERLTEMSKKARVTVKHGTTAYENLMKLLPLMAIYEFDPKQSVYTMGKLPPLPKDGVFKKLGITYDAQDKIFYITQPSKLEKIDKIADKQKSSSIVGKFDELNTELGHDKKGVKAAAKILAELLNEYFEGKTNIAGAKNGNLSNLPHTKNSRVDFHVDILRSLLANGKEYNPFSEVEPVIPEAAPTTEEQPRGQSPQPEGQPTTEEQALPTTEEQPAHEIMPSNGNGENKIVINPQVLNDLQTTQEQQLAATEAINTEMLNTKHQLEQQQKVLEEQNEILRAKDEFEKKLFEKKEIMRYIQGDASLSFYDLVDTVDDALSTKDKPADEFLIASAVQSIINKRDSLEKLKDNERRKKSSQWSKAKIKDIHVEVQRDNNISPLMARTIASIS